MAGCASSTRTSTSPRSMPAATSFRSHPIRSTFPPRPPSRRGSVEALRFAIIGLSSGTLIALVGLGIVVVYRSSGVLNFASGATGAIGAELCYRLRLDHHLPWVVVILA